MLRSLGCMFVILVIAGQSIAAQPKAPAALQEWRDWVLHDQPSFTCPYNFNKSDRVCEWSSGLQLRVDDSGGDFSYTVKTFSDTWITLPGARDQWPQAVTSNGKRIVVADFNGEPRALLSTGEHQLVGKFVWPQLPRTLAVPPRAGLLELTLRQQRVLQPVYENASRLWLTREELEATTAERDSLEIKVFRLFTDSNPALVETRLDIDVSGQEREITTGPFLLSGFTIQNFSSDLPARIEKDGQLRVQVKPGRWSLRLLAHRSQALEQVQFAPANESWPSQEIWAFSAQPQLRTVEVSGLPSIDPRQTQLPAEWQQYPTYLAEPSQSLSFVEQHRGNQTAPASQLRLTKTRWLDFSGAGFTVRDQISGQFQQGRLTASSEYQLGRADLAGTPLLISELPQEGARGLEVRDQNLNLTAVSRIETLKEYPTSGWQTQFDSVTEDLILPPGWSLLHASDADSVNGSWVSRWNLWHIFLFLLLVVALARSFSWMLGALALVTLLLIYHRSGAPVLIWFNFAALYALSPYVKGRFQLWFRGYGIACSVVCLLILLPFMVEQVRLAVYPQLEYSSAQSYQSNERYAPAKSAVKPAAPAMENDMAVEEVMVMGVSDNAFEGRASMPRQGKRKLQSLSSVSQASRYDVGQKIQVGPGLPNWSWQRISLRWSGPVTASEKHQLWLVSPLWNRLAYLFAAFMPLVLLGLIANKLYRRELVSFLNKAKNSTVNSAINSSIKSVVGILLCFSLLAALPHAEDVQAQILINEKLLDEYKKRLIKSPECMPNCSAIESVTVELAEEQLLITMQVHSSTDMAFPLPAALSRWLPQSVSVDDKPVTWLQNLDGQLYCRLLPGTHALRLQGRLDGHEQLALNFAADLHNVSVQAEGWRVNGLPREGQASRSLQLQRIAQTVAANEQRLLADPLTPFVRVTRSIDLGLDWRITTRVDRISPARGSIHLVVPLLEGEAPSSGKLDERGAMQVVLTESQRHFVWQSTLKPSDQLTLVASDNTAWSEVWTLNSSTRWHTEMEGIPAQADSGHSSAWVWLPWPQEKVVVNIQSPAAIDGKHLSIDAVELRQTMGKRAHDTQLNLTLRASQGSRFPLSLPPEASFKKLLLNGRETPVSQSENQLLIPISPGEHQVQVDWLLEQPVGIHSVTDMVDLGMPASNIQLHLELPHDRWLLFVGGPNLGPAVLFWGIFAVVLVIAVILGRLKITPLNSLQWVLLSMGVVTINLTLLMLIAAWFIVLSVRARRTLPPAGRFFNVLQVGLILFSFVALGALLASVPASLLSNPDMMLSGNNSYATSLTWYQDLSNGSLPSAFAISLPILYYRIAMLLWSIWLAFALMRWIPWAWHAITAGGFWFADPKPVSKLDAKDADDDKSKADSHRE